MNAFNSTTTLISEIYQQVWQSASVDAFKRYFRADFVAMAGEQHHSFLQWIDWLQMLAERPVELKISIKECIVSSEEQVMVTASWHFMDCHGCCRLTVETMMSYCLRDGQVIEMFYMWDHSFDEVKAFLQRLTPCSGSALDLKQLRQQLTQRELQCFLYVVQGHTAKQIASELSLSKRTVEEYLAQMKQKLGFDYLTDVVKIAFESGWYHLAPQFDAMVAEGR